MTMRCVGLFCGAMLCFGCAVLSLGHGPMTGPVFVCWHLLATNQVELTIVNNSSEDWLIEMQPTTWLHVQAEDNEAGTYRLNYTLASNGRKLYIVLRRKLPYGGHPWDGTYTVTGYFHGSLTDDQISGLDIAVRGLPLSRLEGINDAEEWNALFQMSGRFVESVRTTKLAIGVGPR
jgi:hypothetical protein